MVVVAVVDGKVVVAEALWVERRHRLRATGEA